MVLVKMKGLSVFQYQWDMKAYNLLSYNAYFIEY